MLGFTLRLLVDIVRLHHFVWQSIGGRGEGTWWSDTVGELNHPVGLALTSDETQLVVADVMNHRLVVVNAADGCPEFVATLPVKGLLSPSAVAIVPDTGQVLIASWHLSKVLLFTSLVAPELIRTFGEGLGRGDHQLHWPTGVALIHPHDLDEEADHDVSSLGMAGAVVTLVAIADQKNDRIVLYRLHDASMVRHFGANTFSKPSSVAVVPSHHTLDGRSAWLAVADQRPAARDRGRVLLLTLTGQVVRVLAGDPCLDKRWVLGHVFVGITVCRDVRGHVEVLVCDSSNQRVLAFALDGSAARVVCGKGQRSGLLSFPAGLAVSASGRLWVADSNNNRVYVFQ
jgi:hypothetical protein